MSKPEASIRVNVDVTNPGQFFACCGLLELADRLWPGAEGWFKRDQFHISCGSIGSTAFFLASWLDPACRTPWRRCNWPALTNSQQ